MLLGRRPSPFNGAGPRASITLSVGLANHTIVRSIKVNLPSQLVSVPLALENGYVLLQKSRFYSGNE